MNAITKTIFLKMFLLLLFRCRKVGFNKFHGQYKAVKIVTNVAFAATTGNASVRLISVYTFKLFYAN